MKLLLLLLSIALANAGVLKDDSDCDIVIGNNKHVQQVLKTDVEYPYQLAIDYDTNTLFFSYSANTDEVFKSAYIKLKSNEFGIISNINGGFANAVDDKTDTVYLGGRDGIYKFDYDTNKAVNLHVTSDNIWQLFYKDALYYTNYLNEKAYKIVDGVPRIVEELKHTNTMLLAINNDNNIYFTNSSGLFCYRHETESIDKIGDYVINGITADISGNIYFSTPESLYYINEKEKQVETLISLSGNNIYGLAIEGNGNIIYAYNKDIVRLNPMNKWCSSNTEARPFYDVNSV